MFKSSYKQEITNVNKGIIHKLCFLVEEQRLTLLGNVW